MPRPNDSPDVRASKTLAYILRHGAEKEGLHMRSDGLISLADVLARPKMKGIDRATVFRIVEENAKKRFELVYGHDPSPPKPKKKSAKGPKKTPKGTKSAPPAAAAAPSSAAESSVDVVTEAIAATTVSEASSAPPAPSAEPEWKELEFVTLPASEDGAEAGPSSDSAPQGEWYIRASQGHSLKLDGTGHLDPVADDDAGRARAGLMVHGTRWELFDTLQEKGLSRMNRQHVHLAPALKDHQITPRPGSTLLVFLDLGKMLAADPPIPVYTSANGVVLTPGDAQGTVPKEYWRKAVHIAKGAHTVVWENGQAANRGETEGEI